MGNSFSINIDENDLKKVHAMLNDFKGAAGKVLVRAINKTLTGVQTDAADEICKVLNVKESGVKKTFRISKAKQEDISGYFASTGNPLALIDLKGTRQTNKGVSVQVRKDHARKVIPGTFIATVKNVVKKTGTESNHEGVFWRKWHERKNAGKMNLTEKAINRSGYIWSDKLHRYISIAWLPREYRLPIEQRYTNRIPDYLDDGPIMTKVMIKANDRIHKNILHETDYELSKHK